MAASTIFPPCKGPPPLQAELLQVRHVDSTPLSPSLGRASGTEQGFGNNSWLDLAKATLTQIREEQKEAPRTPCSSQTLSNEQFLTLFGPQTPVKIW